MEEYTIYYRGTRLIVLIILELLFIAGGCFFVGRIISGITSFNVIYRILSVITFIKLGLLCISCLFFIVCFYATIKQIIKSQPFLYLNEQGFKQYTYLNTVTIRWSEIHKISIVESKSNVTISLKLSKDADFLTKRTNFIYKWILNRGRKCTAEIMLWFLVQPN